MNVCGISSNVVLLCAGWQTAKVSHCHTVTLTMSQGTVHGRSTQTALVAWLVGVNPVIKNRSCCSCYVPLNKNWALGASSSSEAGMMQLFLVFGHSCLRCVPCGCSSVAVHRVLNYCTHGAVSVPWQVPSHVIVAICSRQRL